MEKIKIKFDHIIEECRNSFGTSPRQLSKFGIWRRKMPTPMWVISTNDKRFTEIFDNQEALLKRGSIVWGAVVQANTELFESGRDDCPAAIIYSLDPLIDKNPSILENAASNLFSSKGEISEDEEIQVFADKLADEMVADLKLSVPKVLTEGIRASSFICTYVAIIHRYISLAVNNNIIESLMS